MENVHNSGPCTLSTGLHTVQVDWADTSVTRQIHVRADSRVYYDYLRGEVR